MSRDELIREVVYDDDKIVECIRNAPQSYNSILKHLYNNKTMQLVLRRRIKRLLKLNKIWRMRVPGTRFGLVLFCTPEHDYKILISQKLIGVNIYYMYDFEDNDNFVVLNNYWELKDNWSNWVYNEKPLKIPKYTLRDEGFRLWE